MRLNSAISIIGFIRVKLHTGNLQFFQEGTKDPVFASTLKRLFAVFVLTDFGFSNGWFKSKMYNYFHTVQNQLKKVKKIKGLVSYFYEKKRL